MLKPGWLFLFFLLLFRTGQAQLQSPEQFLGYKIGSRYTPHWKVTEYYKHVAAAVPHRVKLQPYGQTNEGRSLLIAAVSAPAHMTRLDSIRANNLRLAALENNSGNLLGAPVIVWLSYNVHGNEPSSSEAALLTLYALADSTNTRTQAWLQNTVVILDPCLNPDGRDRYVNWFNSVAGKQVNLQLEAREHQEPWPRGRTNHYIFDLNRDWAWQTQLESQQRMKVYLDWLPQIHVDFHEQGVNAPYYFAPAAQPYHQVITPWQRSFQEVFGRNHARYFDEQGWLYFTKEIYDLLYPSYGDTYPTYSGAVGMTYEQGGGSAGGLGVLTRSGDTLTLADRVLHHFTSGLSTVEVASQHAGKLLTEFRNYYQDALTKGTGAYKSYIIKNNGADAQRIRSLLSLLGKNRIRYGSAQGASLRGYDYDSRREESFQLSPADIVIPALQPKGTLVNVLFEPNTLVVDSFTYDITAWSIPYVYGLKAYATKNTIPLNSSPATALVQNEAADPYGYIIRWEGVQSAKLVARLLQKGIKLRFSEEPFESGGKKYDRGSVVVLKTGNQYVPNLWNTVRTLADEAGVQLEAVRSGFVERGYDFGSSRVRPLKAPKVALVSGEGTNENAVGEIWYFFDQELAYPVTLIDQKDLNPASLNKYDVLILPAGHYRFLSDRSAAADLRNWITGGGHLIALESAVAQLSRLDWDIRQKREDSAADEPDVLLRRYESRERDPLSTITPGSIYRVELDNTHPLAFGYRNYYYTLKQDRNIYEFLKDGWNVGTIRQNKPVAGFVGSKLVERLQDGMLFGVQEEGRGTITCLADNVVFRNFWENGKLLFCNAVFFVGQ